MPSASNSFIRTAQYITNLLAGQDARAELAAAMVNFFPLPTWAGVCAPDEGGELRFASSAGEGSVEAMLGAAGEHIVEVLESGFLDTVQGPGEAPCPVVILPIAGGFGMEAALVIAHGQGDDVPGDLLNEYLGIASLAGTMLRRLQLESENQQKQLRLEERTSELVFLKEHLEELVEKRTDELVHLNANLNAILDNIADGLLVTDADGRIARLNSALLNMLGLTGASEFAGRPCRELSDEVGDLVDCCRGSHGAAADGEIGLSEGRFGKAVATGIHRQSADGESPGLAGSVTVIRDTTFEREVDQMKTEFISTVSHELRTPLTSVLGFAKIIHKKLTRVVFPAVDQSEKKVARSVRQIGDNVGIIISEGERLTALINDVLDVAKMEAGKVDWKEEPVSIADIIDRATAATSALFTQKASIHLVKEVEDDLEDVVGDGDRLIQVLINLLSNAVKFTDEGMVACKARRDGSDIVVSVIDSGSGIAENEVEQVFEKFKQVGDVLAGKPTGTGLGLPICKQIVEHHGGRIWAESEVGVGSTFSFTLPAVHQVRPPVAEEDVSLVDGSRAITGEIDRPDRKTVLVVDDEPAIRKLLRQVLTDAGYRVAEAADGMEAIDKARELKPDLITLDVMMPRMGGYEAAAVLKTDPTTEDIPLLVLSATESHVRGRQLGVDHYLAKPADPEVLLGHVDALLSMETSKRKILVVNEDESAVQTVMDALQARNHEVLVTGDSDDAIRQALAQRPAAVIVETNRSESENVAEKLRTLEGLSHVLFLLFEREATEGGKPGQVSRAASQTTSNARSGEGGRR